MSSKNLLFGHPIGPNIHVSCQCHVGAMSVYVNITYPRGIRIRRGRILIHEIRSELDGHLRRTRGALLLRWQHFRAASEITSRKNSTSLQLNNDVKSATRITIPRASTAKCDSRIIFSSFTLAIDHSSRTIYPLSGSLTQIRRTFARRQIQRSRSAKRFPNTIQK